MQWKPIAIAPKNGDFILVYIPGAGQWKATMAIVRWSQYETFQWRDDEKVPVEVMEWAEPSGGTYAPSTPTHWMYLPDAPAQD